MSPERTLREYIEMQLSASGFAVDQAEDDILAWPRGRDPSHANYVIGERNGTYVVVKAVGAFNRKKIKTAMAGYLQNWANLYNMGARN